MRKYGNSASFHNLRHILCTFAALMLLGNCSAARRQGEDEYTRGRAALRSGDYAKARQYFESALKAKSHQEESRAGLLQTLRETGGYREGAVLADGFLREYGNSASLHLERGLLATCVGDYHFSERYFRRSIELAKAQPEVRVNATRQLGELLEMLGRKDEARLLWDDLLKGYRNGRVSGSRTLADFAVAAWRRGYVQDAKDMFMDATDSGAGEISPGALTDFGRLFLEKYNATDAMSVFRDCLKINRFHPDALLGMALAKRYDSDMEVKLNAVAVLKTNPNHTGALNLLSELAMEEEDHGAARKWIDAALAVNSSDLDSMTLKAVQAYLQGNTEAFIELEKRVLSINQSFGRFHHLLAGNLVSRRKYQDAVDFSRKAIAVNPELWPAHATLGMNLMRVGRLNEGRQAMQRAFEGDPFNVWAFNTLELFDQMDQFEEHRSRNFIIRMSREDAPVLTPYAIKLAEEVYATLRERYGYTPQGPVQIEIFPDHGGFAVRTLGLPGLAGALGVCFGKVIAMDSPRARGAGSFNWGSTLWHEFAHVMTLQMTNYNVPRWFSEGISVFEEHRARPGWGEGLRSTFLSAYKERRLLKASELNAGFVRPRSPEELTFAYYQAGLLCEMIETNYGFEKIRQALLLFSKNMPAAEVFQQALGLTPSQMDAEYSRFLDSRFRSLAERVQQDGGASPDKQQLQRKVKEDPDSFHAHLQLGTLLRKERLNSEAEQHLRRAQELFPGYVEQDNPYKALGEMYLELNREEDALAQFRAWSLVDSSSSDPLLKAAEIYRKRKEWRSAAAMLGLSVFLDPYNSDVQKKLAEAAMESNDWSAAVTAYGALVGLNTSDPAGAHYDLARALLASGKKDEAKRQVLRALEIAPSFARAQDLLLQMSEAATR